MAWNRWQVITLSCLTLGYAGYYVCRSNLSVASSLIMAEQGIDKARIGAVASAGVLAYAAGKILNGILGDFLGGRVMFLLAMALSAALTIAFGLATGLASLTLIWCANRFVQSAGWGGATKIVGAWFDQERYGRAMGILALSYLFGDAGARLLLGEVLARGVSWRSMFFLAAALLIILLLAIVALLKSRPQDVGLPPARISLDNVYGSDGDSERPESLRALLAPLLRSPAFWLVCAMSFGLTLTRETFNFWTPLYLIETAGLSKDQAAKASSLFPFCGGLAVLAAGFLSDRAAQGRRAAVMAAFLVPGAITMLLLGRYTADLSTTGKLAALAALGFLIIGPYSFLSGAISLDMGSKRGAATTAGFVDSAGYLGGVLSGSYVGKLAQGSGGWSTAFAFLGAVCLATSVAAGLYWWIRERHRPAASPAPAITTIPAAPPSPATLAR
jgi:OPA family glycerol-3-phosphate transporter-like MFS transporter